MKERPSSTKRFKRLKIAYFVMCLCLEFIGDVATVAAKDHAKDEKSFSQLNTSSHKMSNNSKKQDQMKSFDSSLSRKSRSVNKNDIASTFSDDDSSFDILNESLETELDPEMYEIKRSKSSSLIPFPRMGRSKYFDPNLIMPYPDEWMMPYLPKTSDDLKSNEESGLDFISKSIESKIYNILDKDDSDSDTDGDVSSEIIENSDSESIKERQVDNNGTIIPYPRFGKRYGTSKLIFNDNQTVRRKRTSESLIPQIRYGRSSNEPMKFSKLYKLSKQGMLPYPRPGRSDKVSKTDGYILPVPRFGRSLDEKSMESILKLKPSKNYKLSEEMENPDENPFFLIPYPRPGKRFFGTKPLPPNVKLDLKDKETGMQESKEKEPVLVTFLVPYPRPGRSSSGNQFIIPSLRFGRSGTNSILPYPRPGRSNNKINRKYMLPYPRLGRSNNKISLIPSARFGKSTSARSSSLLPYPRVGKASDSILPYPRFGRSTSSASIIPQLRVGKSDNSDLDILVDEFQVANEYSKILNGMKIDIDSGNVDKDISDEFDSYFSNNIKSAQLAPAKKLQKHMLTETTNYMLPYPRPGRTL